MTISDRTAHELVQSWINGNRSEVIDILNNDHPALAAMVLVIGARNKQLTTSDVNSILHQLIEKRMGLVQQQS